MKLILGLDCSAVLVGSQGQALRAREVRVLDSRPSQRSSLRHEVQAAVRSATAPTLPTRNSEEATFFVGDHSAWVHNSCKVNAPVTLSENTWQAYEEAIRARNASAGLSPAEREIVDMNGILRKADDARIVNGVRTAYDTKFVITDWTTSYRNPQSVGYLYGGGAKELQEMISQAKSYVYSYEGGVIYETNSVQLAATYTKIFQENGITNFKFEITPTRN